MKYWGRGNLDLLCNLEAQIRNKSFGAFCLFVLIESFGEVFTRANVVIGLSDSFIPQPE